jgi:hypothetical protein
MGVMMIHHAREDQVTILEGIFAYLTPDGWVIPAWLELTRETIR